MQMLNNGWGARPRCVLHSVRANCDVTLDDGKGKVNSRTLSLQKRQRRRGASAIRHLLNTICICGAAKLWMMHSKEKAQGSFIERASHICHTSYRLSHDRHGLPYSCRQRDYLIHRRDQDDRLMRWSRRFNKFPRPWPCSGTVWSGVNNQRAWWEYMWSAANQRSGRVHITASLLDKICWFKHWVRLIFISKPDC